MSKILQLTYSAPIFLRDILLGILISNTSLLAAILREKIYRTTCFIDTMVFIVNPRNFLAKRGSALYHGCYILNTNGVFSIGEHSHLGSYCYVNNYYGKIEIGDDVAIGPGTKIIAYSNHYKKGSKVTDERITQNIKIGNNVFIGANCSILPGTIIHDNVVVGAGSVLKGELNSNAIYAGIPCRMIKNGWYE